MSLKTRAAAACVSLVLAASAAQAAPIDFTFTLTLSGGTQTTTALIKGLDSEDGFQQADSITVEGLFDTWVFDGSSGTSLSSSFFMRGGQIVNAYFVGFAVTSSGSADIDSDNGIRVNEYGPGGARAFWSADSDEFTAVTPVPLPAGGLLLLSGLVGVAAFRRPTRRAAPLNAA